MTSLQRAASSGDLTTTTEVSSRRFSGVAQGCIVLIVLAAFLPVLQNLFVDGDKKNLVDNLAYQRQGWPQLGWMFGSFYLGHYQPLVWLTFGLDHFLWWADPFGTHLMSLSIHVVNAVLIYVIGMELFSHRSSDDRSLGAAWSSAAAGIAALGFALHPLRVEPVAWASARGELIGTTFLLLSLFGYLKANAAISVRRDSQSWSIISICAFLFSLLASPDGLVLPIILLIIDVYPLRRLTIFKAGWGLKAAKLLQQKGSYFFLTVLFVMVHLAARQFRPIDQPIFIEGFFVWMLHQLAAPAFYLWKALLPFGLSPAYDLSGASITVYVAAGVVLCAGVFYVRDRWPALMSVWLCYLVLLLPICRGEFSVEQFLADRYTYLAGIPWAFLIGVVVSHYGSVVPGRMLGTQHLICAAGLMIIFFSTLGILTWEQAHAWRDPETLWKHAVLVNPTSRAYIQLANLSEAQGRYDDAITANRRAAELDSRRWDAHEAAARLLEKQGKIGEAVEHYRTVVRLNADAIDARENLAAGLVSQGQIEEAVYHFRKVLELAPKRNETRVKLATVLAVVGRLDEAAQLFTDAAKADKNDGRILLQLGRVLAAQGSLDEAVHYFTEAARLRPEDAEVQESLGRGLFELGKKDEAAKHLREALRILRSSPVAE